MMMMMTIVLCNALIVVPTTGTTTIGRISLSRRQQQQNYQRHHLQSTNTNTNIINSRSKKTKIGFTSSRSTRTLASQRLSSSLLQSSRSSSSSSSGSSSSSSGGSNARIRRSNRRSAITSSGSSGTSSSGRRSRMFTETLLPSSLLSPLLTTTASTTTTTTTTTTNPRHQQTLMEQIQQEQRIVRIAGGDDRTATSGTTMIPTLTISLIKQIVGGCILAIPAGIAGLDVSSTSNPTTGGTVFNPDSLVLGCCIITVMACINAYYFSLVGRICSWTGSQSYQQAWDILSTTTTTTTTGAATATATTKAVPIPTTRNVTTQQVDPKTKSRINVNTNNNPVSSLFPIPLKATTTTNSSNSRMVVTSILSLKTLLSCLAYAMILGDSMASIVNNNYNDFVIGNNIQLLPLLDHIVTRTEALEVLIPTILLPMCIQQDITSLTPFSFIGLVMILGTASTVVIRALDGTYVVDTMGTTSTTPTSLSSSISSTGSTIPMEMVGSRNSADNSVNTLIQPDVVMSMVGGGGGDISGTDNMAQQLPTVEMFASTIGSTMMTTDTSPITSTTSMFDSSSMIDSLVSAVATTSSSSLLDGFTMFFHTNEYQHTIELVQNIAVLACTLTTAFVAHYNAPRFRTELYQPTNKRFTTVTGISYSIGCIIYIIVGCTGYYTFGCTTLPFVLNNYNPNDALICYGNIALAISTCMTYPLPFVGLRDGIMDMISQFQNTIGNSDTNTITNNNNINNNVQSNGVVVTENKDQPFLMNAIVTVSLLSIILLLASHITDLRYLLSIGGGTFSTAVVAIFPTLMLRRYVENQKQLQQQEQQTNASLFGTVDNVNNDNDNDDPGNTKFMKQLVLEKQFATILMYICIGLGGTGVTMAVQNLL